MAVAQGQAWRAQPPLTPALHAPLTRQALEDHVVSALAQQRHARRLAAAAAALGHGPAHLRGGVRAGHGGGRRAAV